MSRIADRFRRVTWGVGLLAVVASATMACAQSAGDPRYNPTRGDDQNETEARPAAKPKDAGTAGDEAKPTTPAATPDAGPAAQAITLSRVDPTSAQAGAQALSVTLTGTGFSASDLVDINGQRIQGTVAGTTTMRVNIGADKLQNPGTINITVVGASGATASNSIAFAVTSPAAPTISGISPTTTQARGFNGGGQPLTLTVNGSGFTQQSVVTFNGQDAQTSFSGASALTAQIPSSMLTQAGSVSVSVRGAQNIISTPVTFTIQQNDQGGLGNGGIGGGIGNVGSSRVDLQACKLEYSIVSPK